MFYYDLETTFLSKGYKRKDQQILEVGIVKGRSSYSALVDPLKGYPIIPRLKELGQHPERTIRFWTKLLAGKGLLNTADRRKSVEEQAEKIDAVRADFVSPEEAIKGMVAFGTGTWVAHNGKAFDHKIIQAHFDKYLIKDKITFLDSLPPIRKLKLPSHSLGYVYKHLFGHPFRAHHALDDAKALQRVCRYLKLFDKKTPTSLVTLKGVGRKTEAVLKEAGILSVEDLAAWFLKGEKWEFKTYKNLHSILLDQIKCLK